MHRHSWRYLLESGLSGACRLRHQSYLSGGRPQRVRVSSWSLTLGITPFDMQCRRRDPDLVASGAKTPVTRLGCSMVTLFFDDELLKLRLVYLNANTRTIGQPETTVSVLPRGVRGLLQAVR